jgi:hypothetical protein
MNVIVYASGAAVERLTKKQPHGNLSPAHRNVPKRYEDLPEHLELDVNCDQVPHSRDHSVSLQSHAAMKPPDLEGDEVDLQMDSSRKALKGDGVQIMEGQGQFHHSTRVQGGTQRISALSGQHTRTGTVPPSSSGVDSSKHISVRTAGKGDGYRTTAQSPLNIMKSAGNMRENVKAPLFGDPPLGLF